MIVWPGTLSVQPLPKIGHAVGADERLLPFGEGRVEHHLDPAARVAYHLPDGVEGDDEAAVDPEKEVRRQFFAHLGQRAVDDVVFPVVGHQVEVLAVGHEIGDLGRSDRFHPGAHVYQEAFLVNGRRLRRGAVLRRRASPPR